MNKNVFTMRFYFSYSQFMVYDESVEFPGCAWTEEHSAQGFARRESVVNFGTPQEFGYADVTVRQSDYEPQVEYKRVIGVPFLVRSGKVIVCGPEELNCQKSRFDMPRGNYRLIAAQGVTGDQEETIHLFFEALAKPLEQSVILVADEGLSPPAALLETAGIAGQD